TVRTPHSFYSVILSSHVRREERIRLHDLLKILQIPNLNSSKAINQHESIRYAFALRFDSRLFNMNALGIKRFNSIRLNPILSGTPNADCSRAGGNSWKGHH
ncbi:Unknown protein, partial [Striga hermonthica]